MIQIIGKGLIGLLALYGAVSGGFLARRVARAASSVTQEQVVGTQEILPVVIIGSGPAGLAAAKTVLEDSDEPVLILEGAQPGGPLNAWTPVGNWPGKGITSGNFILSDMRKEVEAFKNVRFIARSVVSVDFSGDIHSVVLDNGELLHARTVIIAMGTRSRKLNVSGAQEYAHLISYEQKTQQDERPGKYIVIGSGIDATRKAGARISSGSRVTLIVRGSELHVGPQRMALIQGIVEKGQLDIRYDTEVVELLGDNQKLSGVRLSNGEHIEADRIVVGIGRVPNTELFKDQLALREDGSIILHNDTQQTSRAGVYAAGDITNMLYGEGAIAAGDGMKAGKDIVRYLQNA